MILTSADAERIVLRQGSTHGFSRTGVGLRVLPHSLRPTTASHARFARRTYTVRHVSPRTVRSSSLDPHLTRSRRRVASTWSRRREAVRVRPSRCVSLLTVEGRRMATVRYFLLAVAGTLLASSQLSAQGTGAITGRVVDSA